MLVVAILLTAVLSYLLGSCNSAIIVGKLIQKKDIRDYGSHNAGLTNTLRCFGKGCAALTLIGDLGKGIVAVLLSKWLFHLLQVGFTPSMDLQLVGYIAGFCHFRACFPSLLWIQRRKRCTGRRVCLFGH